MMTNAYSSCQVYAPPRSGPYTRFAWLQGSQKELKDGQGRLERDVQWLKGNLSSLHSAQDFAAKEWKGIKQRVAEVEAKAREVHSQPQAAADHLSLQPVRRSLVTACGNFSRDGGDAC